MTSIKQIRICGFGGQGIVFAGSVLGKAAILDGQWVSGANAYGSQARGGVTRSEVVISDQPIKFPHIIQPDILIALSQNAYQAYGQDVKPEGGLVVFDTSQVTPQECVNIKAIGINATDTALQELGGGQTVNIVVLGAVNTLLGIVRPVSLLQTIRTEVPAQHLELNLKALNLGIRLGEGIQ